jgi:hypothetical protein
MSVSLKLELVKPIDVGSLMPEIGSILKALLGLTFDPVIRTETMAGQETISLQTPHIESGTGDIRINIVGEPEAVTVYPFTVPFSPYAGPPYTEPIPPESIIDKLMIGIYPDTCRTPLELALAAAIAVAFGRHLGSEVVDPIPFFTKDLFHPANSFFSQVKVDRQFDNYRTAAQEFYDNLPKAKA